jgi:hypothetical protein
LTSHSRRPGRFPFALALPLTGPDSEMTFLAFPAALSLSEVAPVPIHLPDQFHSLREVAALPNTPYRLHLECMSFCSVNHTGGLITRADLSIVAARAKASERHAADCERTGAWHDARHDCGSEFCLGPQDADGWVVHDFYRYDVPEEAAEDAGALERRRQSDAERKRRERERKAAVGQEPARRRGRPPKRNNPVKPQVKNMSRDMSRDRISADPDRSDLDFDLGLAVSQSGSKSDARTSEKPESAELIAAVADAIAAKTGHVPSDAQVLAVIAKIRERAAKAESPIRKPLTYIPKAVANEPDLYAGLLAEKPPPLADILAEARGDHLPPGYDPAQLHEYSPHWATLACTVCEHPRSNWRHPEARTA